MITFEESNLRKVMMSRPFCIKAVPSIELRDEYRDWVIINLQKKYAYSSSQIGLKKELNLYDKKVSFFENSHFTVRINEGRRDHMGYVSYMYDNGLVIMERYFNDYNSCELINSNIYITDLETFFSTCGVYNLSREEMLSRDDFITMRHTNNFDRNIQEIIEREDVYNNNNEYREELKKIISLRYKI